MDFGLRFLLIRSGGLGDSILTLPVAVRLREMHPAAELHLLGNGNMLSAARLTGLFAGVRSLDEAGFSALFAGSETTPFLRAFFSPFDRVYCFTAGNAEEVSRTILESGARDCRTLDPRPPQGWERHIAEYFLSVLGAEGKAVREPLLPGVAPRAATPNRDLLVIHPGSGGVPKTWPLDRFIRVAERWHGDTVFLLGPAELDRGYAKRISGGVPVVGNPSLSAAVALLSSAGVYLGNDSGASHLAALCGTPSVVLFGPTDPRVWKPLGKKTRTIVSPDGTMEGIGVDEVMRALQDNRK